MKQNQRHRRLVLLIFIPPLLAICLCVALLTPRVYSFLNSPAYPDYLWSQRISRVLKEKGYSLDGIVNVSRSEQSNFSMVGVGVDNQVNGKQPEPYELVKEVHTIIMETYEDTSPHPQPVDTIFIIVGNYYENTYAVEVNFRDVQEFQAGTISEKMYFERWKLLSNTLEIAPP